MFEAAIESIIEDREAARAEGREEGMETVARNAIAEGVSLDLIHKITGIDMVTLENMQADKSEGA